MKMLETGGLLGQIERLTVDAAADCRSVLIYTLELLGNLWWLYSCAALVCRECGKQRKIHGEARVSGARNA